MAHHSSYGGQLLGNWQICVRISAHSQDPTLWKYLGVIYSLIFDVNNCRWSIPQHTQLKNVSVTHMYRIYTMYAVMFSGCWAEVGAVRNSLLWRNTHPNVHFLRNMRFWINIISICGQHHISVWIIERHSVIILQHPLWCILWTIETFHRTQVPLTPLAKCFASAGVE